MINLKDMDFLNKFKFCLLFLLLFSCGEREEDLIVSEITIALHNNDTPNDSIETLLSIRLKPQNKNIFIPSYLILRTENNSKEIYLNQFVYENYLQNGLLYSMNYVKLGKVGDFEKLKSEIEKSDIILPNGEELEKDPNLEIIKSNFEYINFNKDLKHE